MLQYYCMVLSSIDVISMSVVLFLGALVLFSAVAVKKETTVKRYYNGRLVDSRTYESSIFDNLSLPSPNWYRSLQMYIFCIHCIAVALTLIGLPKYWNEVYMSVPDYPKIFVISIFLILGNLLLSFCNMITARWSFPLSLIITIYRILLAAFAFLRSGSFRIFDRSFIQHLLLEPEGKVIFSRTFSRETLDRISLAFIILWAVLILLSLILPFQPKKRNISITDVPRKYFTMLLTMDSKSDDAQSFIIGFNIFLLAPLVIVSIIGLNATKTDIGGLVRPAHLMWKYLLIVSAAIFGKNLIFYFSIFFR